MKINRFDKITIVKNMSRAAIGTVPGTRVVPQKNKTRAFGGKHKKRDLAEAMA
jgi:hypothetical protein